MFINESISALMSLSSALMSLIHSPRVSQWPGLTGRNTAGWRRECR